MHMKRCTHVGAALAVLAVMIAQPIVPTAHAAVSECRAMLAGKPVEAGSEQEARKAALQDWLDKAGSIGPEYTRWQLAFRRQLVCERTASGRHRCQAVGMPCAVKQVPPKDAVPLKRGP